MIGVIYPTEGGEGRIVEPISCSYCGRSFYRTVGTKEKRCADHMHLPCSQPKEPREQGVQRDS